MTDNLVSDDILYFDELQMTEEITRYVPGGLHPVTIGDILSGKYRIMHKLGWGGYATVWLAQKTDETKTFVAVKITKSNEGHTQEASILRALSSPHVITLLDHFTLQGPNGIHSVFVTNVVVPYPSTFIRSDTRRIVARGLAQAVADIHAAGVVHGDLHVDNIGLDMPELADQDPSDVMQGLGPHELFPVLTTSAAKQTSSLPPYIVFPCSFGIYYSKICLGFFQTKIFDFGSAHYAGTSLINPHCAAPACSPEFAFARFINKIENLPVGFPDDIWAFGTALFQIISGIPLFGYRSNGLPCVVLVEMAGYVPSAWKIWYDKMSKPPDVSPDVANKWWAVRWKLLRPYCVDDQDADALVKLLRKVLVLDPAARPTILEILQDPWLQRTAPRLNTNAA
ncbi:hypothetical protein M422DRAFT_34296 [Sphaerobolus stellatus SS14]|uniref:non-specific serine/threonine protein kinase n=1 Tax=Sphaerobolus stellatus (strain SS14) TaxID=990650 RepID=A0A0C9V3L2_SPHS4|nr:hypothetical protein M422DRAFT_34296 [Sphaerobolus stellatus SS14]